MYQSANQRHLVFVEHVDKHLSACGSYWILSSIGKSCRNLPVKFIPVGDYHYSCIRLCLLNPLCQHHHCQTLAAALRMPNNTVFLVLYSLLRSLQCKVLVRSSHLLHSIVIHYAITNKPEQSIWSQHLKHWSVKRRNDFVSKAIRKCMNAIFWSGAWISCVFSPLHIILLRSHNRSIIQAFRIVTCHTELHRSEETRNLSFLLVSPVLTHSLFH